MLRITRDQLVRMGRITELGRRALAKADKEVREKTFVKNAPMDIVAWMETLYLPAEATNRPGPLRLDNLQKGLFRALQEPGVEWVSFQKPPRFGATVGTAGALLYFAVHEGFDVFYTERTEQPLKKFYDSMLWPIADQSDAIKRKKPERGKFNWTDLPFDNGTSIQLRSATTDGAFRQIKANLIVLDECSNEAYQAGGADSEGDKPSLAWKRATQFRKPVMFLPSTPNVEGLCIVSREYKRGDQRVYEVPCPHCGVVQQLLPRVGNKPGPGLKYALTDTGAVASYVNEFGHEVPDIWYECMACEGQIRETDKASMIEKGDWRATATPERPGLISFYSWAILSQHPKSTWLDIVNDYLASLINPQLRQSFKNLTLALPWAREEQRVVPVTALEARAEPYEFPCPDGVKMVTWGNDNQRGTDDGSKPARGEIVVVGWGFGEESWVLGHFVIEAVPFSSEWKKEVYRIASIGWKKKDGTMLKALAGGVDVGYDFDHGIEFCHETAARKQFNIKAVRGENTRNRNPTIATSIGTSSKNPMWTFQRVWKQNATDMLVERLRIDVAGPGRIHTPRSLPATFYESLTAFHLVKEKSGATFWRKDADSEVYDCFVYAYARMRALMQARPDLRPLIYAPPPKPDAHGAESAAPAGSPYDGPDRSANSGVGAEIAASAPKPERAVPPAAPVPPSRPATQQKRPGQEFWGEPTPPAGRPAVPQQRAGQQPRTWGKIQSMGKPFWR